MPDINRPAVFSGMAGAFTTTLGNVDVTPVVDGVDQAAVRGILRQRREIDLVEEAGAMVEGVTHVLSLAADAAELLVTDRDSVRIEATTYLVRSRSDDGRAMARLFLKGDI